MGVLLPRGNSNVSVSSNYVSSTHGLQGHNQTLFGAQTPQGSLFFQQPGLLGALPMTHGPAIMRQPPAATQQQPFVALDQQPPAVYVATAFGSPSTFGTSLHGSSQLLPKPVHNFSQLPQ